MMCFSCARVWTPLSDSVCLQLFVSMCANKFSSGVRVTCETSLHVHTSTWHHKIWNPNLSRKARAPRRFKFPKALRVISLYIVQTCSNKISSPSSLCSISQTAVGCESSGPPCSAVDGTFVLALLNDSTEPLQLEPLHLL